MTRPEYEIRADYDRETIVIYQAFGPQIALPALEKQTFVPPFSFQRMTWIKPSFLWLMARSNWGQKAGQEHVLAVRIRREGWDKALGEGVLTHSEKSIYPNSDEWHKLFGTARVHIQWDPEYSIRGSKLPHFSIQVGISRHLIEAYVRQWIVSIEDYTPLVRKLHKLCKAGQHANANKQLPPERPYPVSKDVVRRLGMKT
ncbi:MAG: DUF4291 domain-containing protein [Anaerolineae bacterium]|nr:DUF4291 domain-containing protein [Anaerolineae bacterium]